jgi:hypothetical protein
MTSLERQEGNVYGNDKEPAYNILTYTWGRWEVNSGPKLVVRGVTWEIPAIDEKHFKVESLRRVLQRMTVDVEHVWIDAACIDQENDAVKMDEVGRQAGIFQKAKRSYAWLNWHAPEALKGYMDTIFRAWTDWTDLSSEFSASDQAELLLKLDALLDEAS